MDWTGHTMAAAAAAAELGSAHGNDLDAGLAKQGVGVGIAVVVNDHAGLERDDIVAVVPLLTFGLPGIAAGLDHDQRLQAQRLLHHLEERLLVLTHVDVAGIVARIAAVAGDLVHDLAEYRALIS